MYNFAFMDPYATVDGVSVGYNLYFRETDYGEYNVANYLNKFRRIGCSIWVPNIRYTETWPSI